MSADHQRIRFMLAYDGTFFHGWATQPGLRTVQGVFEQALQTICRQPVAVTVAGRTDAGVHARGQVAHADIPRAVWETLYRTAVFRPDPPEFVDPGAITGYPEEYARAHHLSQVDAWYDEYRVRRRDPAAFEAGNTLMRRLNSLLAHSYGIWMADHGLPVVRGTSDVVVRQADAVNDDFDARFSAWSRTYSYVVTEIGPDNQPRPLSRWNEWWISGHLDIGAMYNAAQPLRGEHDFLSFCKPREGATTIRTLMRLHVDDRGNGAEFLVTADAFCHSMVRSLVGALVQVGLGRRGVSWPGELLARRSRQAAAPLAPPQGLTLEVVNYPPSSQWRARQNESRQHRGNCCGETE